MTRGECSKAIRLADRLVSRLAPNSEEHAIALKLRGMLIPLPTPKDILQMVMPEGSIRAKSKLLGISRQHFYNLQAGEARPGQETMQRLVKMTGLPEATLREVW